MLGLALIALGYLLLGPSPVLARWLPQTLAGSLGALAVGAAGMAMAMVPSTPLMIAAVSARAAGDAERSSAPSTEDRRARDRHRVRSAA